MHTTIYPTLAFLNNINPGSLFVLAVLGLLLFGKDLPTMARSAAKQYFRYKKMITDATADIKREMDDAANRIEEEKRKIQRDLEDEDKDEKKDTFPSDSSAHENSSSSDTWPHDSASPGSYAGTSTGELPPKPQADPLSLDVASPGSLSHQNTAPAKSPAAQAAALDSIQKNVPPPKKIPPPL